MILNWFLGYVKCQVKSGYYERFFNLCRHHNIKLWDIVETDGKISFCILVLHFRKIKSIVRKSGVLLHITEKKGCPFLIFKGKKQWPILIGFLIFLIMLWGYSEFVWKIEISGQREYTKESLLKSLREVNVYPGMLRKNLECDGIETYLRKKYERLSWVSAEEVGSRLILKVKEGSKTLTNENKEKPVHLIASCDGIVDRIVTAKGTPLVKKGQQVKKGDILIQGIVEVKDDNKVVIGKEAVKATGDIVIKTTVNFEKIYEKQYDKIIYDGKKISKYVFLFGDKSLSIKNPLKKFDKSAKYDIINKVCLNNDNYWFGVDFSIMKSTYSSYTTKKSTYTKEQIKEFAKNDFADKLQEYQKNDCKILSKKAMLWQRKTDWLLQATILMNVPQQRTKDVKPEEWSVENGTENGNSDGT